MIISVSTIYGKSRAETNVFQKHLPEVFSIREQLPLTLSKTCQTLVHVRPILHWHNCMESVHIRSFSGQYFPAFRLNTERYSVSLHIQSRCNKIRTRKTPNTDVFLTVYTPWKRLKTRGSKVNKNWIWSRTG